MIECNDTALLDFLKQYQWGACECGHRGDRFIPVRELSRRMQTEEDLERNAEELVRYRAISGDPPAWAQEALEDLIQRQRSGCGDGRSGAENG